jgi:hypothetical protein
MFWGCAGTAPSSPADYGLPQQGYTLVTLHPDEARARLYSVNYQQGGLIPPCTPVTLHEITPTGMQFTVNATGRTYTYLFHDTMGHTPSVHLGLYFGATCKPPESAGLSKIDLDGIAQGRPIEGMSKMGVVYAMGYPPPHVTPSLEANAWVYWKSRFDRVRIIFSSDNVVAAIQN